MRLDYLYESIIIDHSSTCLNSQPGPKLSYESEKISFGELQRLDDKDFQLFPSQDSGMSVQKSVKKV